MNGENAKFIFQWELFDNAIGLGARILLEAISGFLLKYYQSLLKSISGFLLKYY